MDFSWFTTSELKVTLPPLHVSEISELPEELFAGSGM